MSTITTWGRARAWLSGTLVFLLALGSPGTVAVSAAARAQVEGCGLAVTTEPAGAAVFVDGELRGETPLSLEGLAPGDHRVRVAKDGYLENSRVVSLRSGDAQAVRVKLTPASQPRASATQVEEPPAPQVQPKKKGGGGGKILLIGLGVAAVGTGVYLLLPKNKAPIPGTVVASPSTAIMGGSNVSFTAQGASDPDNDPLTFSWNFGDGSSGTGNPATHVYNSAGTFNVTVTVSDGKKSATATGSITVRSLAGRWTGPLRGTFTTFNTVVNFGHSGSTLSGNYVDQFPGSGTVTGRVSSPLAVTFTVTIPGFQPWTFTGTADSTINTLTGVANGSGFVNNSWTLTRN
jgi:hypothetical protein